MILENCYYRIAYYPSPVTEVIFRRRTQYGKKKILNDNNHNDVIMLL